ncbi:hypothetical protein [Amycolatopsis rubida]|uniref:Uncharacterized protein n=1 Tax=Amycolatopsis rubida TaxID=112413 RepID=A0A1I5FYC0_9PSEU|nr:hypothetical protein [Amycolatopsis rubida]SFO28629.1 hypothetical protein SAMN05421854_1011340 [Amycolatopsis rubida]
MTRLIEAVKRETRPAAKNVKADIEDKTFIEVTSMMLDDLDERNTRLAPTFAFVDPVGVKATPMSVLLRLTIRKVSCSSISHTRR